MDSVRFSPSEYEKLAMRLLQCLYLTNPNMARLALKRENFEFNKLSSLEVASTSRSVLRASGVYTVAVYLVMSHSEDFVGHSSVQEVFDVIWSGESAHKVMLRLSADGSSSTERSLTLLDQRQAFRSYAGHIGLVLWTCDDGHPVRYQSLLRTGSMNVSLSAALDPRINRIC